MSCNHYNDIIMNVMASQITSLAIVYSSVYPGADQRKHQSSASLAFVPGIHRWPVNSPHKGPVTLNMFPFDDVILAWNENTSMNRTRPHVCHLERHRDTKKDIDLFFCIVQWYAWVYISPYISVNMLEKILNKAVDYSDPICHSFRLIIVLHI